MLMKTNEETILAQDYGTQAFREGRKAAALEDPKFFRLLAQDGANGTATKESFSRRLALIQAWKAGWESAYRAEFI